MKCDKWHHPRLQKPERNTPSELIETVFPNRFGQFIGFASDLVAVVAVAFGIAGSLGMGVMQINAGLADVFGTPADSMTFLMGILAVLILFYMIPITTDLSQGIKLLSNVNLAVAILLMLFILVFLSTSAASGAYVLGMMTTGGSLNPPLGRKLFWGCTVAILTAAVLFAGGGVQVLRAIAISGALPFTLIMITQVACLLFSLGEEAKHRHLKFPAPETSASLPCPSEGSRVLE